MNSHMLKFNLEESDDIVIVDIEHFPINGIGEMSTVRVSRNGTEIYWWPCLGPWQRGEKTAAQSIERF